MKRVVRNLRFGLLFSCMLIFGQTSQAGTYTVSYSGGSTYSTSSSSPAFSPQGSGWTGTASASGYLYASALVNGTITATFKWVRDPALLSDPPPSAVIVSEHCTAMGDGYAYYSQPTVSVDDGFGDQAATTSQSQTSIAKNSTGYRSSAHSGESFTVTCSPSVTTSGSACSLYASVSYSATTTPAVLNLSGVTPDGGSNNVLIGQGVTASVDTGNIQQTAWAWTISGDPFAGFELVTEGPPTAANPHPINTGHALELAPAALTQATVPYFYRSIGAKGAQPPAGPSSHAQTVTCTATVANLNPNLPPFQVTVTSTVKVYQPDHTFTPTTPGALRVYINDDGSTWFQAKGNLIPGILYTGTVTTPSIFVQGQNIGSWNYTQLVRPTASYTANGTIYTDPNNAHKGLDGRFPYAGPYIADGSDGVSRDSPGKQVNTTMSRVDFKLEAWTWMLYTPPAHDSNSPTTRVPLHELDWTVKGYAIYDAVDLWQYDVAGNGFTVDLDRPTSVLPDWIELITRIPY